jgi:hypothetical protein
MDPHASTWIHVDPYGFIWAKLATGTYEFIWINMGGPQVDLHECMCIHMDLHDQASHDFI